MTATCQNGFFKSLCIAIEQSILKNSFFAAQAPYLEKIFFAGEIILAIYLLVRCFGINKKEFYIPVLIILQTTVMIFLEVSGKVPPVENAFYVDNLSIIMALIIGIIGTLICIYALGYMKEYHEHHTGMKDNRRGFFFIFFLFYYTSCTFIFFHVLYYFILFVIFITILFLSFLFFRNSSDSSHLRAFCFRKSISFTAICS